MAEFKLTFEVDGDVQLERSFARFAENVKDAREPFREIAIDFHEIEREQFESEGGRGSGGWKPLSHDYAEWKAENFPGAKIMVQSGLLKGSLTGENPWSIESIEPLQMTLGTKLGYAKYHQRGGRKLPQRWLIDLTESDKKRWTDIFHSWLVKQANKEFAGIMPVIGAGRSHVKRI